MFRKRFGGRVIVRLLPSLAQRFEQRVLRPLDRPIFFGKAISQDFSADEIQASISSAVAVTNTGSQPMP